MFRKVFVNVQRITSGYLLKEPKGTNGNQSIHQHIKTVNTDRLQSSKNIKRTHKKPLVKACSFSCYCLVVNKLFYFKCGRYKDSLYTLIHVGSRPIRISLAGKYTIKINIKICNLKTVLQQLLVSASILAFSHQSRVPRFFKNVESDKHNSFAQKSLMISQRTQRRLLYARPYVISPLLWQPLQGVVLFNSKTEGEYGMLKQGMRTSTEQ